MAKKKKLKITERKGWHFIHSVELKNIEFSNKLCNFYAIKGFFAHFRRPMKHINVLNHSPNSPDLNLIENLWAITERDQPELIERTHDGLNANVRQKMRKFASFPR